jgi:hopanoid biosynthesis associated protein HpnK
MVAGPAAAHALAIARRLPGLRVGLHLVLVEGRPVLPAESLAGLVDGEGAFRRDMVGLSFDLALRAPLRRRLAKEIDAQFAAFERTGLVLDHVNAHKHFHVHPLIASQVLAIGVSYGMRALRVPCEPRHALAGVEKRSAFAPPDVMSAWARLLRRNARRRSLRVPDSVFGVRWSGAMTAARLAGLIGRLPPGLVEIYLHPATEDGFPGAAPGYRYRDELAALVDPDVIAILARSDHRPGGYADAGE